MTKKDEQDGSFLIIDDSVSANQLPDTAVQLFDAAPKTVSNEVETASVPGVSFFSEPTTSAMEAAGITETASEITFFTEPAEDVHIEMTPAIIEEEADIEESKVVSFTEESAAEVSEENVIVPMVAEIMEFAPSKDILVPNKIDFNAYIAERKAELEKFISNNMQLANIKDEEIIAYNAQIAEAKEIEKQAIEAAKKIAKQAIDTAKESAKNALEERKNIELENDRIKEMAKLLSVPA